MRTIKFRAWDKLEKKWLPNTGDIGSKEYPVMLAIGLHGLPIAIDKDCFKETEIIGWNRDHNIEITQFTGLHDKNGKEIYDGDIIEWIEEPTNPNTFHVICWIEKEGCWGTKDGIWLCNTNMNYKVIGNIYENPELLK